MCLHSKRGNTVCLQSGHMSKMILCEMHHGLMAPKWGQTQWMFLCFMISGTRSLIIIHQPPVLTTALGHDIIIPCQLTQSEKMATPPVLYWDYLTQDTVSGRLWPPSETYKERVNLTDNNPNSSDKSILLKEVQWSDSGKYLCKLSVTMKSDEPSRKKGNETLLMVYDTMTFNLTHNDSPLWCQVNVTRNAGFVLSIFRDGCKLRTAASAPGDAALPYVTLSESVSLRSRGKYECQLHLNKDLITKSSFHYHPPVAEEDGDAERNVSVTCPTAVFEPGVVVFPEPWLLYAALLLVPITVLLGLITVMLMGRR